MAGNSKRLGAVRKSKKGALVGTGGQGRQSLVGRGDGCLDDDGRDLGERPR